MGRRDSPPFSLSVSSASSVVKSSSPSFEAGGYVRFTSLTCTNSTARLQFTKDATTAPVPIYHVQRRTAFGVGDWADLLSPLGASNTLVPFSTRPRRTGRTSTACAWGRDPKKERDVMKPKPKFPFARGILLLLSASTADAATLTVTNLADNGPGTLRQLIAEALRPGSLHDCLERAADSAHTAGMGKVIVKIKLTNL